MMPDFIKHAWGSNSTVFNIGGIFSEGRLLVLVQLSNKGPRNILQLHDHGQGHGSSRYAGVQLMPRQTSQFMSLMIIRIR